MISLLDLTALLTAPPSSSGLLSVTCPLPRTSYEPMLTTQMKRRWLTGKQQMHTRPPICFKSKQSVDATPQWIFAQYASVFSLLCPCLVSSTMRRERQRGLSEASMAKDIRSHYGSMEYYSSGFYVYFLKPFVLCCPWGWGNVDFAMGKQEKKEASVFGGEGVTCVVLGEMLTSQWENKKRRSACV